MKLFLFKPSSCWIYCGGGLAIVASSFENCKKFCDEQLFRTDEEAEEYKKLKDIGCELWTLVEEFEVQEETERLVFNDYNWG